MQAGRLHRTPRPFEADQIGNAVLPDTAAKAIHTSKIAATRWEDEKVSWNDMETGMGLGWLFGLLILVLVVLATAALIKYLRS